VAVVPNFATDQECKELVKASSLDEDMLSAYKGYGDRRSKPST
jgi:hypothetical protein